MEINVDGLKVIVRNPDLETYLQITRNLNRRAWAEDQATTLAYQEANAQREANRKANIARLVSQF